MSRISRAGNFSPIGFAKKIHGFRKIRELDPGERNMGTVLVLAKAANLVGIVDPISDINKADIRDLLLTKHDGISLEELDYAFRHDRYSGEPTPHYQLFNAEYVGKVIKRYQDFIRQVRIDNNLKVGPEAHTVPAMSEKEKVQVHEDFLRSVFGDLKEKGTCDSCWILWDQVKDRHGKPVEVLQRLFRIQTIRYRRTNMVRKQGKWIYLPKEGEATSVRKNCRSIVAGNYLRKHLESFELFKTALGEDVQDEQLRNGVER